jgi:hypothetical protein
MATYYCMMSEFYSDGTVKAALLKSRSCAKKPRNTYKNCPGMTAFKDWFETKPEAEAAVARYRRMGVPA